MGKYSYRIKLYKLYLIHSEIGSFFHHLSSNRNHAHEIKLADLRVTKHNTNCNWITYYFYFNLKLRMQIIKLCYVTVNYFDSFLNASQAIRLTSLVNTCETPHFIIVYNYYYYFRELIRDFIHMTVNSLVVLYNSNHIWDKTYFLEQLCT